jgi:ribosomal protein S18 acetylase RimI-like enzyme
VTAPRFWEVTPNSPDDDWEALRELRNQCRAFMTGDQTWIAPWQQQRYRHITKTGRIFLLEHGDVMVGFLKLRPGDDEHVWVPTYGVAEASRGRGYGRLLVALSQVLCDALRLDVLHDNVPARKLYASAGFSECEYRGNIVGMHWRRSP